jgi:hypothetical protein
VAQREKGGGSGSLCGAQERGDRGVPSHGKPLAARGRPFCAWIARSHPVPSR